MVDRSAVVRTVLGAARDPVVWIFLLAGTFEVLSGDATLHALLLYAVAAVLVIDVVSRRARGGVPPWTSERPAVRPLRPEVAGLLALGAALFVVGVGLLRRYTYPVTAAVTAVALPVVVWGWRAPARQRSGQPALRARGVVVWVAPLIGLAVVELISLFSQPSLTVNSEAHPTFSTLMDPVLAHPWGRMIGLAIWLAAGWFLARV